MNHSELVQKIATNGDIHESSAALALDAFIKIMTEGLKDGDRISIRGFGSFEVRHRNEYVGRNRETGLKVTVPAGKHPVFSAGSNLKAAVK